MSLFTEAIENEYSVLLDKEEEYELEGDEIMTVKKVDGFKIGEFYSNAVYGSDFNPILLKKN